MTSKYDQSIGLACPTCGGTQFAFDEAATSGPVKCAGCDLELSRDELVAGNSEKIRNTVENVKKQAVKDIKDQLRKALSGNKHVRLRF